MGQTVWGEVENHKRTNFTPRILAKICRVLYWTPDSIDRIRRGEDPLEISRPAATTAGVPSLSAPVRADIATDLEQAAITIEEVGRALRLAASHLRSEQ
jgi:hypothetical protein